MAAAADDRPLVCIVDDAQWLDRASAATLTFVARRLLADPVALVFAVREPSASQDLAGLPSLLVEGLPEKTRVHSAGLGTQGSARPPRTPPSPQPAQLGTQVRFRYLLIRSATIRAASQEQRRSRTPGPGGGDRRSRSTRLASGPAVNEPDEEIAGSLERSAGRAQARGGVAATAAFLERAAELTPDPIRRGSRALAAAQAKFEAAAPEAALALLVGAEQCPLDELQRGRVQRLHAQIEFATRRGSDAPRLLLRAADRLAPLDAALARETYLQALAAAIFAGRLGAVSSIAEIAGAPRGATRAGAHTPPGISCSTH